MRPHELFPPELIQILLTAVREERDWIRWELVGDGPEYKATVRARDQRLRKIDKIADLFSLHSASIWLVDGPKAFAPTVEQAKALEHVEVNLTIDDYRQPYPAIVVQLPKGYEPFHSVLVYSGEIIAATLWSERNEYDITTTIAHARGANHIEKSINTFDDDCQCRPAAVRALRVALNSCLALSNWPTASRLMYPKEIESDTRLASKAKSEEARRRAKERLSLPVMKIEFTQEIKFHHVEGGAERGEPTGRQVSTHWRRGHWAMLACGQGRAERRLTFRRATLVRGDLFEGDTANTTALYKG